MHLQQDRAHDGLGVVEVGQVVGDRVVQRHLARLYEPHHQRRRELLRDGADAVDGPSSGGHAQLRVGGAVSLLENDLAVPGHGHGDPRCRVHGEVVGRIGRP